MSRDRKRQPHIHPAGIMLYRCVQKLLDLGKGNDLVKFTLDLDSFHAEDRAVHIDIFAARQFIVKTRANLEQAADPPTDHRFTAGRFGYPGEYLEQRRFSCAVTPDYA